MQVELSYPVFVLPRKSNMVYVYFKEKDLKSTSEELLQKLDYTNLDLIDVSGYMYKIKKVFKVKYLGLWGFNPLLKGRQILVDFEYAPEVEKVLLSDFKKDIIHRIDKTKQIWQPGWDMGELKEAVTNSSSFEEIADLLK
ncbi:hypothetical protein FAZ19_15845 [Sphingobacterium alkalisoli]|uniref:Uncharacterized protein n=1 Tax=Sphingobacterium alkalisoli TaxID=1874115 RepID=A0A4U0GX44_9SPHI|nr:hypothetical protein [Sphingobacterium alkalisoli]TJY63741.1 hypothetical protein FAZ19_15845 [Sphingobacterium alkalisoli]GGH25180.1 hypothetical protein GCM10011418_33620 [Sphingobacterium alkalisoli]